LLKSEYIPDRRDMSVMEIGVLGKEELPEMKFHHSGDSELFAVA